MTWYRPIRYTFCLFVLLCVLSCRSSTAVLGEDITLRSLDAVQLTDAQLQIIIPAIHSTFPVANTTGHNDTVTAIYHARTSISRHDTVCSSQKNTLAKVRNHTFTISPVLKQVNGVLVYLIKLILCLTLLGFFFFLWRFLSHKL